MLLLEDEDVCFALGVDSEGMCLRHPNIRIALTNSNANDKGNHIDFHVCRICQSELEAGGVTQRKSFAYAIQQVQRLHQDSEEWNRFKQNWDCGENENDRKSTSDVGQNDEKGGNKDFVENKIGGLEEEEEEKKDTNYVQEETIPSRLTDEVRRALLRVTQVQERAIVEKDNEIKNLKLRLEESERANDIVRKQFEEKNLALQATILELQSKVLKQEKTIKVELKTIRSIATKRAESRTSTKSAQVQQSTEMHAKDMTDRSLSISSQADPPRLPSRKASGRDGKFKIGGQLDVATSNNVVVSGTVSPHHKEEPPKLPIRQSSSPQKVEVGSTLESAALRSPHGGPRAAIVRNVTNQQDNTPPAMPRRQVSSYREEMVKQLSDITESLRSATTSLATSTDHVARSDVTMDTHTDELKVSSTPKALLPNTMESSFREEMVKQLSDITESLRSATTSLATSTDHFVRSDVTMDTHTDEVKISSTPKTLLSNITESVRTATTSLANSTDHFARSTVTMDTHTDELKISSIAKSHSTSGDDSQQQPTLGAGNFSTSIVKGGDNEGLATKSESKHFSSQEISFVPTDFEAKGGEYHPDHAPNSSVPNIKFDENHQLLLEASQALSSSVHRTPYTSKHRKKVGSASAIGESMQEIDLSNHDLEFSGHQVQSQDKNTRVIAALESVKDKKEEEMIQDKVFGTAAIASEDDEQEDESDLFGDLPTELPVGSDRFLVCNRSVNLSPVSALTTGSYLLDLGLAGVHDDEDCNDGPKKSLQQSSLLKRLPLEENFDSDESGDGNYPAANVLSKNSSRKKKMPGVVEKSAGSRNSKKVTMVENKIVQDKYGDGGMYSGHISVDTGLPHGFGKMKYENGRQYEGDWKGGRWHGFGRWVNPNEDVYEGTFVYDARHGSGTYTWKNGNIYSGDFFEDKRQGKGTFNFANGNTYVGDFVNGVFEGNGTYTFGDGFYEGEWAEGRYHGQGFLLFSDNSSYRGGFVRGVAHGQGRETSADGTVREGLWHNGRPIAQTES